MKLDHIDLSKLKASPLNVRKHGGDDVADLMHSIRQKGVLQTLLVRPDGEDFEVIAGGRRLKACQMLALEGEVDPLPCGILEEGDDAAAIEASLAENIDRLPMNEFDQFTAFAALIGKGRTPEDIASHFGVTERLVKQRLALANLDKRILSLVREGEINGDTARALTMATKNQQKQWLKLYRNPESHAPRGHQLRQWLLGGAQIATSVALFPLEDYAPAIINDLFGEDAYFSDPEAFWTLQRQAIAEKAAAYKELGWAGVVTLEGVSHWPHYDYRKTPKKKSGKVYVAIATNGEVGFHEGYLPEIEVRQAEKKAMQGEGSEALAVRPELTKAATNYCDLHRHAAVQAALLHHSGTALRLIAAHMIAGSSLWDIRPEPRRADKPEIRASVEASSATLAVQAERDAVLTLLGFTGEDGQPDQLVDISWSGRSIDDAFDAVMALSQQDVVRVLTYAMVESLAVGTRLIDTVGTMISGDMHHGWQADHVFLDSIASKGTLLAMLRDVGGNVAADAHKGSTAKVIRNVIWQYASGEGREKIQGWVPPYLMFPMANYGESGGEAAAVAERTAA